MFRRRLRISTLSLLLPLLLGYVHLAVGQDPAVAPARPKVAGDWTGTWAPTPHPPHQKAYQEAVKSIDV